MQASKEMVATLGRLLNRAEFLRAQKQGRKWVSKGVVVEILPQPGETIRYGLTVSKRVSKSAVVRNRIRRRLRAVACDVLPFYRPGGFDIVLIGRAESATRSYEQLKKDLCWCLEKLDLEKTES